MGKNKMPSLELTIVMGAIGAIIAVGIVVAVCNGPCPSFGFGDEHRSTKKERRNRIMSKNKYGKMTTRMIGSKSMPGGGTAFGNNKLI